MVRSMSGFGRCVVEDTDWIQTWEIRSVNSRHLDLKWRLPSITRSLEPKLEKIVHQYTTRGRVDIQLTLQIINPYKNSIKFNSTQASIMLDALKEFAIQRGDDFSPNYTQFLTISSLWEKNDNEQEENTELHLQEGLITALEDWNESRETEGFNLVKDLLSRTSQLKNWLNTIEEYAPKIKDTRFALLKERISNTLLQLGGELEDSRFLQEIVILTDRLDVTEEIIRLSSHLERLNEILKRESDVGRRLDFTLQECFKEISTCGNKVQDIQISRIIVDFKNELEKCREQVQNLE